MKIFIRGIGLTIARTVGPRIVDYQAGRELGRAFLFVWRGKIHVIGLEPIVRPIFLPQRRLTYWRQTIGFTVHPPPDFPKIEPPLGNSPVSGEPHTHGG